MPPPIPARTRNVDGEAALGWLAAHPKPFDNVDCRKVSDLNENTVTHDRSFGRKLTGTNCTTSLSSHSPWCRRASASMEWTNAHPMLRALSKSRGNHNEKKVAPSQGKRHGVRRESVMKSEVRGSPVRTSPCRLTGNRGTVFGLTQNFESDGTNELRRPGCASIADSLEHTAGEAPHRISSKAVGRPKGCWVNCLD